MKAQEVMTKNTVTIDYKQTALDAVKLMLGRKIRHLPVLRKGKVIGILSVGQLQSLSSQFHQTQVGDICDKFVVYASPESDLAELSHAFTDVKVEAIPVLDIKGHLMGIITQFDFIKLIPELLLSTKSQGPSTAFM
jgi:acetoin utilization protein AcuB